MNIAITANGAELESTVYGEFSKTPYLLIVNVDTMKCSPITHRIKPGSGEKLAKTVLEYKCEAVITGKLEEKAFNLLADDGITRYFAENITVRESLEQMEQRKLTFIRNIEGTSSCSEHH